MSFSKAAFFRLASAFIFRYIIYLLLLLYGKSNCKKTRPQATKSLFALKEDNRKKLSVVAAIEGSNMQEIVNLALEEYFMNYEKKNRKILAKL